QRATLIYILRRNPRTATPAPTTRAPPGATTRQRRKTHGLLRSLSATTTCKRLFPVSGDSSDDKQKSKPAPKTHFLESHAILVSFGFNPIHFTSI
ncbi:hypothetical protein Csa_006122, partial [Cucumis sativus]